MFNSRKARRIAIDAFLWVVIFFCTWMTLTRHFIAFWAVSGRWQVPSIRQVHVGHVQKLPYSEDPSFDRLITVNADGSQKVYRLLKEELYGVQGGDNIWLINSPYVALAGKASPPTFRFSVPNLFLVFPEVFLLICGFWLFLRFRSRLGKPYDAYEGSKKPTTTYVVPPPDSWGRSRLFIGKKDQDNGS
ncbi:MAG: hypothetical protein FWG02_09770 [Holophagaceae bacterium]|nr:hypothetical protein [Holophagaceae bacterium]